MDLDMLAGAFVGPRGPGEEATPAEHWAAAIAQLVFPLLIFCLVAFAGLYRNGTLVLVVTVLLSLAGYVIARRLSQRLPFALWTAIGGTVWNCMAAGSGFLLGALMGFYAAF